MCLGALKGVLHLRNNLGRIDFIESMLILDFKISTCGTWDGERSGSQLWQKLG